MGGKVAGEWIVIAAFALGLFGLWRWNAQVDTKDDAKVESSNAERIKKLEAANADLKEIAEKQDTLDKLITAWGARLELAERTQKELDSNLADVQEHYARLRESVTELRSTYPRHIELSFKKGEAFPFEIMHPTAKPPPIAPPRTKQDEALVKKVKKQVQDLSK